MPSLVSLSPLTLADGPEFVAAALGSHRLHGRWVHPPQDLAAFAQRLEHLQAPSGLWLGVRRRDSGALAGSIELSQIVLGSFRSAYLAYLAFEGHAGQGLMRAGVGLAVRHAFGPLKLHRLEANIQPENQASIALVKSCGFEREGYSPRYLKIGGRWRDHERWAIRAD
ncbi:GNAT family N-acetyltransferase [Ideonella sp. B508-1]|uniref:GNAT family N-acetyltransferase n=1 Tax=Ideonella sp. B508-1 TaxID=137716 RepID=UPI000345D6F8|nr:GNAT family protein [Ideonella sp. B508-1]